MESWSAHNHVSTAVPNVELTQTAWESAGPRNHTSRKPFPWTSGRLVGIYQQQSARTATNSTFGTPNHLLTYSSWTHSSCCHNTGCKTRARRATLVYIQEALMSQATVHWFLMICSFPSLTERRSPQKRRPPVPKEKNPKHLHSPWVHSIKAQGFVRSCFTYPVHIATPSSPGETAALSSTEPWLLCLSTASV